MRRHVIPALFLILVFASCSKRSEESGPSGGEGSTVFSVSPSEPLPDREITVRFRPEPSTSSLAKASSIELRYSLVSARGDLYSEEIPMAQEAGAWTAALVPKERMPEGPALMVCAFVDPEDREVFNNNRDNPWLVVFRERGAPVPGANLQLSRILYGDLRLEGPVAIPVDRKLAESALEKERAIDPENPLVKVTTWERSLRERNDDPVRRDSLLTAIRNWTGSYFLDSEGWKAPKREAFDVLDLCGMIGEDKSRDSLAAALFERFPGDSTTAAYAMETLIDRRDLDGSVARLRAFLDAHAESPVAEIGRGLLLSIYMYRLGNPNGADDIVRSGRPIDTEYLVGYAEWVAAQPGRLGEAEALFRRSVEEDRARTWSPRGPASRSEWIQFYEWQLGRSAVGLAGAIEKKGRLDEAASSLAEVVAGMPEAPDPEILGSLARLQEKAGRPADALATYERLADRWKPSEEVVSAWRGLYDRKGASVDFDAALAGFEAKRNERLLARLANRATDWPAPDIRFEDASGGVHALSEFRGKVVLIDFWATWCGPCQRSLPHLAEVRASMAGEEDLVVLPVNVWERTKGEDRRSAIAENWKSLGLTAMPYYLDPDADEGAGGASSAADRFHVSGIPTSFVIGRDGKVLFKTVGYEGPSGDEEFRAKIAFALRKPHPA